MLTKKVATIEEHHTIVGGRYKLAQIIMRRSRELINGAPIKAGLPAEFKIKRTQKVPSHRIVKTALEELRLNKLTWSNPDKVRSQELDSDVHNIVFGE